MTDRADITKAIEDAGVIAVVRLQDSRTLLAVVDALVGGGVRAIEITMTLPGAVECIRELAAARPGLLLGAGTVIDADTAERVVGAGATFVVSPVLRRAVLDAGHRLGVPVFPGCFSPTEILDAWDAGADIVKVFPATSLGTGFFKDVRGPMPQVKLMPTGGVTLDNAGDWIRAGAVAVGVGSALLDAAAIAAGRFQTLTANARRVVASVERGRRGELHVV